MHVLYLNPSGRLGGAETSLLELLRGIRILEPSWRLSLILGEDGELAVIARSLGVEVHVIALPDSIVSAGERSVGKLFGAWVAACRYRRLLGIAIQRIDPQVIHTNGFKMHLFGAWSVPIHGGRKIPLVCHLHDYVGARRVMRMLMALSIGRFAAVVTNSRSVAADLMRLPVDPDRVTCIYNGIDTNRFTPEGPVAELESIAQPRKATQGLLRVGLVATFATWKGHETFLKAIRLLPCELPIRAYIIGGPIYRTGGSQHTMRQLQDMARDLGIAERICFTGFLPDSPSAMRALDIVVHASTQPEPFGMVIIEAMACGKAVIVSRAGGAEEIFEEGRTALGHTPGNASDLASRIALLAEDKELRTKLGEHGRAAVIGGFRASTMAAKFADVYSKTATPVRVGTAILERVI